jgi:hypothetical protein
MNALARIIMAHMTPRGSVSAWQTPVLGPKSTRSADHRAAIEDWLDLKGGNSRGSAMPMPRVSRVVIVGRDGSPATVLISVGRLEGSL